MTIGTLFLEGNGTGAGESSVGTELLDGGGTGEPLDGSGTGEFLEDGALDILLTVLDSGAGGTTAACFGFGATGGFGFGLFIAS